MADASGLSDVQDWLSGPGIAKKAYEGIAGKDSNPVPTPSEIANRFGKKALESMAATGLAKIEGQGAEEVTRPAPNGSGPAPSTAPIHAGQAVGAEEGGERVAPPPSAYTPDGYPKPAAPAGGGGGGGGGGAPAGPQEQWLAGPTQRAQFDNAFAAEGVSGLQNRDAINKELEAQKAYWQGQAKSADARQQGLQEAAAERNKQLEAHQRMFEQTAAELADAKIDPNLYWANKTTSDKIGSVIGTMLGGFVAGVRGGPNLAMDQINREIDRSIDAQKANYAIRRDQLGAAHTAFGMTMAKIGDERQSEAVLRMSMLDKIDADVKAQAAGYKQAEVQNGARDILARIEMERAKYLSQAMAYVRPSGGSGGLPPGGIDAFNPKKDEAEVKWLADKQREMGIPDADAAIRKAQELFDRVGNRHGAAGQGLYNHSPWLYARTPGVTDEDVAYKQAIQQARNEFIHSMTGAGMGVTEAQRYAATIDGSGSPASIQNGLRIMRDKVMAAKQNIESGVKPGVVEEYNRRHGMLTGPGTREAARPPPPPMSAVAPPKEKK